MPSAVHPILVLNAVCHQNANFCSSVFAAPPASKPTTAPASNDGSSSAPKLEKDTKQSPAAPQQAGEKKGQAKQSRAGKKSKPGKNQRKAMAATAAKKEGVHKGAKRKLNQSTAGAAAESANGSSSSHTNKKARLSGAPLAVKAVDAVSARPKGTSTQKRAEKRAGMTKKSGAAAIGAK